MTRLALNAACEKLLAVSAATVNPSLTPISGKATSYGFEYDFLAKSSCEESILVLISEQMRRLILENCPFEQLTMMPQNAAAFLKNKQPIQAERCDDYPSNLVPLCKLKNFYDICPYEMLASTNQVRDFVLYELLLVDAHHVRIRGACFEDKKALKKFVKQVELAKKSDPCLLAQELNLVTFADTLAVWQPKGIGFCQRIEAFLQKQYATCQIEPFNCMDAKRGALALYELNKQQNRALPYRFVHAVYNQADENDGLFVCEQMLAKVVYRFCSENQLQKELISSLQFMKQMASILQIECRFVLLRRKKGSHDALEASLALIGAGYEEDPADASAIELRSFDGRGRAWPISRLSLVQESVRYLEHMIVCSMERLLALLLEKNEGYLPFWLSPEQMRFLTVSQECVAWTEELIERMKEMGVVASIDSRSVSIGEKMQAVHRQKVPCLVVVGNKELKNKTLSVRFLPQQKDPIDMDVESFLEKIKMEDMRNT